MNKFVYGGIAIAIVIVFMGFKIYSQGAKIELLTSQLNATAQAKATCEQKSNLLTAEIAHQNEAIEKIKIDSQKAMQKLLEQQPKTIEKWSVKTETIYVANATCPEQLKQIDAMQESFYEERK